MVAFVHREEPDEPEHSAEASCKISIASITVGMGMHILPASTIALALRLALEIAQEKPELFDNLLYALDKQGYRKEFIDVASRMIAIIAPLVLGRINLMGENDE